MVGYPKLNPNEDPGMVGSTLGWLGTAASVLMLSSPFTTMQTVVKAGSTLDFSDTPYVAALLNCGLWVIYGVLVPDRLQPLVCNGYASLLQVGFIMCFLRYHPPAKRLALAWKVVLSFAIIAAVAVVAVYLKDKYGPGEPNDHNAPLPVYMIFLSIACDFFNAILYASPLVTVATVIRTRSVEFMPLGFSLGTLVASLIWASYGLWIGDIAVALPNDAGIILGIIQLAVYFRYAGAKSNREHLVVLVQDQPATTDLDAVSLHEPQKKDGH